MALGLESCIVLPEHQGDGGFDHAAVHHGLRRKYVAHTANDALDVIDLDATMTSRHLCPGSRNERARLGLPARERPGTDELLVAEQL